MYPNMYLKTLLNQTHTCKPFTHPNSYYKPFTYTNSYYKPLTHPNSYYKCSQLSQYPHNHQTHSHYSHNHLLYSLPITSLLNPHHKLSKVQTDSQIEEEITLYEDDSVELINFMKRIGPSVCEELERNGRSYAFNGYSICD